MNHHRTRTHAAALLAVLALAACAGDTAEQATPEVGDESTAVASPLPSPSTTDDSPEPSATDDPTDDASPAAEPSPSAAPSPTTDPAPTTGATMDAGPIPDDIVQRVVADAVDRSGVDADDLGIVRADAVQYSDGSLGCPQPGRSYIQVLIDGYWLVLDAAGTELDYRIGSGGDFRLCEGGGTDPAPNPDV